MEDMISLGNPAWRDKTPSEVASFVASGLADGLHNNDRLTEEFERGIIAPYADEEGKISLIRNASALTTNHTMEIVDRHKDIVAPSLVLWGVHDPWQTIADGERLAREIPNAHLKRIENASHWLQQDAPETFAEEILNFLRAS
jgi:pimeloyl-ACP methyl ester carboxylesterase